MNALRVLACSALALSLAACNSSSNTPASLDDGGAPSTPVSPDNSGQPDTGSVSPISLQTPEYKGELLFSSEQVVDLNAFLAEAGLRSVNASYVLSQDGQSVRVDVTDDQGFIAAIALVDIDTGETSWLAKDISPDTRMLFDAKNQPVAVFGVACQAATYTPESGVPFMDITGITASDQCISQYSKVSANGNVIVFGTYDPHTSTQYLPQGQSLHTYTLDTASVVDFPETNLLFDGVTLTPRSGLPMLNGVFLSDDGRQFFASIWWEGADANGGTVRKVGAVLIDTASGTWSTRALANDMRGCTPTEKVSCNPPYSYVMSNDGDTQFSMVPTDNLRDTGGSPFIAFETVVEQTGTDAPSPILVSGAENADLLAVNADGSVLLLFTSINSNSERQGFGLIQPDTGDYVSMNRALNACPLIDDAGNSVDVTNCQFTTAPISITNSPAHFSADGSTLLIHSVSRFSSITNAQVVEGFLIDVDEGAAYSLPGNFSGNPDRINADASVMLGISDYPEYNLLISKR